VPSEGEPRKLGQAEPFHESGLRRMVTDSRKPMAKAAPTEPKAFFCKNSPALPPVGCSFLRPAGLRSGRTFLRSLHPWPAARSKMVVV
jgi:hypothetical protein